MRNTYKSALEACIHRATREAEIGDGVAMGHLIVAAGYAEYPSSIASLLCGRSKDFKMLATQTVLQHLNNGEYFGPVDKLTTVAARKEFMDTIKTCTESKEALPNPASKKGASK